MLMIAFGTDVLANATCSAVTDEHDGRIRIRCKQRPVPDGMKHDRILEIWYVDLRLHRIFNLYVLL